MAYLTGWSGGAVSKTRLDELVDRAADIRWFVDRLNEAEPRGGIVQVVAPYGYGKSWLLSALLHKYAIRVRGSDDYDVLADLSDEIFARHVLTHVSSRPLPAAYVNLETTRDAVGALLELRRQLRQLNMRRFDFVLIVLLRRTRQLDLAALRDLLPTEAVDLAIKIADAALDVSEIFGIVPATMKLFSKHFRDDAHEILRKWNTTDDVAALVASASNNELLELLPQVFVADLNEAACERPVVLLFDSVDAIQPSESLSQRELLARDEWLRVLLRDLDPQPATLAVLATRGALPWATASKFAIPADRIETRRLRGFPRKAAEDFLIAHGVTDEGRRQEMLALSEAGPDEHQPILLYLQAANASVAANAAGHPPFDPPAVVFEEFTNRLRASDDADAFVALCAPLGFTYEDYARIAELVRAEDSGAPLFTPSRAQFDRLTSLEIVNRDAGRHWQVAYLARKLAHQCRGELTDRVHAALAEHYQQRDDDEAFAEEVYHRALLDWVSAYTRWQQLFRRASAEGRIAACDALLDRVHGLGFPAALEPVVLWARGEFSYTVGRLDVAREAWTKGLEIALGLEADPALVSYARRGAAMNLTGLGTLEANTDGPERGLARYAEARRHASGLPPAEAATHVPAIVMAEARLRAEIGDYDRSLQLLAEAEEMLTANGDADAGAVRTERARLLADIGRHAEASAIYEAALAEEGAAPIVQGEYGMMLASLGELDRADELTAAAQAGFQQTLDETPGRVEAVLNSANASLQRSRHAMIAGDVDAAKEHAALAIDSCDRGLARVPDALALHVRRADAALEAAEAWSAGGDFERAIELIDEAEASLRRTLEGAPTLVKALDGWARAAGIHASVAMDHGRLAEAEHAAEEAEERFARAAAIYPTNIQLGVNRTAYLYVGVKLHMMAGRYDEARPLAARMTEIARIAPNNIHFLLNGGNGWIAVAIADLRTHSYKAAEEAIGEARERLRMAYQVAPNHPLIRRSRTGALNLNVEILLMDGRPIDAEEASRLAMQAATKLGPPARSIEDLVNIITAHRMRAEALLAVNHRAEARQYLQNARALAAGADSHEIRYSSMHLTGLAARLAYAAKELPEALREAKDGVRLARSMGEPGFARMALDLAGAILIEMGDFDAAMKLPSELADD